MDIASGLEVYNLLGQVHDFEDRKRLSRKINLIKTYIASFSGTREEKKWKVFSNLRQQ